MVLTLNLTIRILSIVFFKKIYIFRIKNLDFFEIVFKIGKGIYKQKHFKIP